VKTFVIGDIHSGLKALEQVLERAHVSTDDLLIFLGDYVDSWSDAVATVDFLLNLSKTHQCLFLKGNHDELCYDWLCTGVANPNWLAHGGQATLMSYEKASEVTIEAHKSFYESLQLYHLDGQNRLYLHAGFTNLKGVEHEYFDKMFYWDRTLWELALSLHPGMNPDENHYPERLKNYHEIFIGHTPVTRIGLTNPQQRANVWNVDTGAAFKGPLTVMDVDSKKFWQSDPVHTFYPNEKGRN
jgi:serine/threonine protein phosphatase 1